MAEPTLQPAHEMDGELAALGIVLRILKALPSDSRARIIVLLVRRFGGTFNEQRAIATLERQQ
jgi:hypothetical protein